MSLVDENEELQSQYSLKMQNAIMGING